MVPASAATVSGAHHDEPASSWGTAVVGSSGMRMSSMDVSRSSMWSTTRWSIRDTAQADFTIWWTMKPMYQPIDLRIRRLT